MPLEGIAASARACAGEDGMRGFVIVPVFARPGVLERTFMRGFVSRSRALNPARSSENEGGGLGLTFGLTTSIGLTDGRRAVGRAADALDMLDAFTIGAGWMLACRNTALTAA